jgi:tetratricopeptide (TPR) repeat protein
MSTEHEQVAEQHAEAEDFAAAVAAQRQAVEAGTGPGEADPREMLAWYLLKAGEDAEAAALWETLLAERPDDPELVLTAGVAHRDAERYERAADLLARALEAVLRSTLDAEALREAAAERTLALAALGRAPEAIDRHAEATIGRLERQAEGEPIAAPWYAEAEYAVALERLPAFAADWSGHDHASYSRELDRRLRDVSAMHGRAPLIVPVRVDAFLAFASEAGLDPDWAETRARYADEHRSEALDWPPGRNDDCWCGAGAKYKRHCGT